MIHASGRAARARAMVRRSLSGDAAWLRRRARGATRRARQSCPSTSRRAGRASRCATGGEVRRLRAFLRERQYDVVHAVHARADPLAARARRGARAQRSSRPGPTVSRSRASAGTAGCTGRAAATGSRSCRSGWPRQTRACSWERLPERIGVVEGVVDTERFAPRPRRAETRRVARAEADPARGRPDRAPAAAPAGGPDPRGAAPRASPTRPGCGSSSSAAARRAARSSDEARARARSRARRDPRRLPARATTISTRSRSWTRSSTSCPAPTAPAAPRSRRWRWALR